PTPDQVFDMVLTMCLMHSEILFPSCALMFGTYVPIYCVQLRSKAICGCLIAPVVNALLRIFLASAITVQDERGVGPRSD
uniref:Uncharacterized protein n=1 Tax=Aegilops tauschii subsp. strangulata TaxID=200361 RepID=A0A453AIK5_AEGTS